MWQKLATIVLVFFGAAASTGLAQTPPGVRIESLQAIGTGCPDGSFSGTISPNGQAFSLLLDNFIAESSMQSPIKRLNCELRVNFYVPAGWTFAVLSADYRGFAYVEEGTTAIHQALYSFDGSKPTNERPGYQNGKGYTFRMQEFRGPYNDNYYIHHELDPRIVPWAPCRNENRQTLFLTTFLMARNLNPSSLVQAQIALDSIDGTVQSQSYQLAWRQCTPHNRPQPPVNPGRPPRYPGNGRG